MTTPDPKLPTLDYRQPTAAGSTTADCIFAAVLGVLFAPLAVLAWYYAFGLCIQEHVSNSGDRQLHRPALALLFAFIVTFFSRRWLREAFRRDSTIRD